MTSFPDRLPSEPILIPCEGGEQRTPHHLCAMCGNPEPVQDDGWVVAHQRDDIIARVKRGDFG